MEYMTWLRFEKHIDLKDNDPLFYTRGTCEPLPAATGETTTDVVMAVLADGPIDRAGLVRAVMARKPSATLKQIDSALYSLKSVSKRIFAQWVGLPDRLNPEPPSNVYGPTGPRPTTKGFLCARLPQDAGAGIRQGLVTTCKFHDMRRTGGIRAIAGRAPIRAVADKLANSIDEIKAPAADLHPGQSGGDHQRLTRRIRIRDEARTGHRLARWPGATCWRAACRSCCPKAREQREAVRWDNSDNLTGPEGCPADNLRQLACGRLAG